MADTSLPGPTSLVDFSGTWSLTRTIVDRHRDETGRFTGTASITGTGPTRVYREEGQLTLADRPPVHGTRVYFWRAIADEIVVTFDDNRPFHRFTPGADRAAAEHLCRADLYRVTYDFRAWPAWRAVWDVKGPAKDYRLVSNYSRACTPPGSAPKLTLNDFKTGDGSHGHDDR